ncbi:MAG TPA: hypothetical protein EYN06_04715 [Myxococcales bacterium]|nr:hypothetical protein [Myxococcales bacterium]HIN85764.1 hypothetical protein [Myxococcales bacterium]
MMRRLMIIALLLGGACQQPIDIDGNHSDDTDSNQDIAEADDTAAEVADTAADDVSGTPLPIEDVTVPGEPTVEAMSDGSFLCTPPGQGPFAGVLYNHGGLGNKVGGDLEGTCKALAKAGYVGFSKKRRETRPISGHLDDLLSGLEFLVSAAKVDGARLALLGFSRGGFLTLQAAKKQGSQFSGIVIMAPAPVKEQLSQEIKDLSGISAPLLLLVAENDEPHVALVAELEQELKAQKKDVQSIVYPPFGRDGHALFFTVGDYWNDILVFLEPLLK